MTDDPGEERVQCARHGQTLPTFACIHLAQPGSTALGACYDANSTEPWPPLVCNRCNDEPPWTHEQTVERLRVLCSHCWDDAFARNSASRHDDPDGWLHEAVHRVQRRQDLWVERYDILDAAKYRYGLEDSPPWLGFGPTEGHYDVLCEATVIGSWSSQSQTWLWGWANDWWGTSVTGAIIPAKRAGERLGLERLWRSSFAADEPLAWGVSAAALDLLPQYEGIYRCPTENGSLFLATCNTRRVA